jgi:hypothetical protein
MDWNLHLLAEIVNQYFNTPGILQEEANEISLCQFSKMSRWGEITSSATSLQRGDDLRVDDYRRK